jgi:SAM-dependent methyltransferase
MARFGQSQIYHPEIRGSRLATLFLKVFGSVDTGSSHLHFLRVTRRAARTIAFDRVLDAGCGSGKFSFWLAQEHPNAQIEACDLSADKIDLCKEIQASMNIHNINFFVQDLRTYRRVGGYDFIFSNHVLEHIPENRQALSNLVASASDGGWIYIQMPSGIQRRLAIGRRFVQSHEQWERKEHIGEQLTLDSLCLEFERSGCEVLVRRHTEGLWGELRFELSEMALSYLHSRAVFALMYPLLKVLGYIDSFVSSSDGNGLLVVARKIPASGIAGANE